MMCPSRKLASALPGLFLALLSMCATSDSQPSGPRMDFYNYSGVDATVSCMDYPPKTVETGETLYIPLTRSDQACIVSLEDEKYVTTVVSQVLPGSSNSGLSVSVDINDTFVFFSLDETTDHQYVTYSNSEERTPESWSNVELWWVCLFWDVLGFRLPSLIPQVPTRDRRSVAWKD